MTAVPTEIAGKPPTTVFDAPTRSAIEAISTSKAFGGMKVLVGASFAADAGEVHALVGENGAGKSTLIKILGGRVRPDAGVIRIEDKEVRLSGPEQAHRLGVWTVFQELTLLPAMSVAENLLLTVEPRGRLRLIDRRALVRAAEHILVEYGLYSIDPRSPIENLPLAERQMLESVRAISRNPAILLLDEPTSSLADKEVQWLRTQIQQLCQRGTAIVFTSHRWNEIRDMADRVTIFRNGTDVGTFQQIGEAEAITLMTGKSIGALYPQPVPFRDDDDVVLDVERLTTTGVKEVNFRLGRGEILGLGGLTGHGHRELLLTLFGAQKRTGGMVRINSAPVHFHNPRNAVRRNPPIALVPEERKTEGLLLSKSIRENAGLAVLHRLSRFGILNQTAERDMVARMVSRLRIRAHDVNAPVETLSGGNQQKVLLGRWLLAEPEVLLLHDVTRGVDVATKREIYDLMVEQAALGRSIIFYSSDAEELAHVAHRVLVMREGAIVAELSPPNLDPELIVSASIMSQAQRR